MIFLDTNVFMYHIGGEHPLRAEAREFVARSLQRSERLVTSAEVLQELIHVYVRSGKTEPNLADAFTLAQSCLADVWSVERADVELARNLLGQHPELGARDLVHLACCIRREPDNLMTFDRALAAAWRSRAPHRN